MGEHGLVTFPVVSGGVVFVGTWHGVLHAVDAATGAAKWAYKAEHKFDSSPVFSDGMVFVKSHLVSRRARRLLFAHNYEGMLHAVELPK